MIKNCSLVKNLCVDPQDDDFSQWKSHFHDREGTLQELADWYIDEVKSLPGATSDSEIKYFLGFYVIDNGVRHDYRYRGSNTTGKIFCTATDYLKEGDTVDVLKSTKEHLNKTYPNATEIKDIMFIRFLFYDGVVCAGPVTDSSVTQEPVSNNGNENENGNNENGGDSGSDSGDDMFGLFD